MEIELMVDSDSLMVFQSKSLTDYTNSHRNVTTTSQTVYASIIIPAYNLEKNIVHLLERLSEAAKDIMQNYEVIVVDDGSYDGTLEVLTNKNKVDGHIRVISYKENCGKGFAVRMGVIESKGSVIVFIDGDCNISPSRIREYIEETKYYDLVIGSKTHVMSKVSAPWSRTFLSRTFNFLVRLGTGISLKDTQSGLKAGNGESLRKIFSVMLVKRYAFDVELLCIATLLGLRIKEMPVDIKLSNKFFRTKEMIKMLLDVASIAYRLKIRKWYQKRLNLDL